MAELLSIHRNGLSIREVPLGTLWQVAAWPESIDAVASAISEATGSASPGPGDLTEAGLARVGPLTWWLFAPTDPALAALKDMAPETGTLLDLSGSRARFEVAGEGARALLMRLSPIDFREAAFPPGRIVTTVAHHMSIAIARDGIGWSIFVSGSFAGTFAELLQETAAQWPAAAA